ncbi:MAG TPA: hypothetical protein VEZ11_03125 [Thermoanaerobaculia bacterium]|nr:hypothetical protein [Thermoanaerobaculia bacterium]
MSSLRSRAAIGAIYAASSILVASVVYRYHVTGGLYVERPASVMDHSGPDRVAIRDALVLMDRVAPLIPRRATVTCFRPKDGDPWPDTGLLLTAAGRFARQSVLDSSSARRVTPCPEVAEYVVAIAEPFTNPCYAEVARYPEGALYRRR